ncbi:MAG: gluconate 2-dehydrogenase subunit 3 family protein [Campylobacterales bacterium]|nr:gluconate 2-dehydrogenase subunit 3 family protein [Campylobacterales bacterium]
MILNSRRIFLKTALFGGAVLVMYGATVFGAVSPMQTMALVQEDLFPHAKSLGIKTEAYLTLILSHSKVTPKEKDFLRNGVQWLNEEAVKMYKKMYSNLSESERQAVLKSIAKYKWGEKWINKMLTYIMEATFSDEIYGVCKNSARAAWLKFETGYPHPKEAYL